MKYPEEDEYASVHSLVPPTKIKQVTMRVREIEQKIRGGAVLFDLKEIQYCLGRIRKLEEGIKQFLKGVDIEILEKLLEDK